MNEMEFYYPAILSHNPLPTIQYHLIMIEKIANNKFNTEQLNLNSPVKVKEKLDYYRSLLGKTHDLAKDEFENQKLTELRDWLLPMLMNGQVKVN